MQRNRTVANKPFTFALAVVFSLGVFANAAAGFTACGASCCRKAAADYTPTQPVISDVASCCCTETAAPCDYVPPLEGRTPTNPVFTNHPDTQRTLNIELLAAAAPRGKKEPKKKPDTGLPRVPFTKSAIYLATRNLIC